MRTLWVLLLCSCISFICAQYESQPLTYQPIPVLLRFPDSAQRNPSSLQYSLSSNGKPEDTAGFAPLGGMNDNVRPILRRYDSSAETVYGGERNYWAEEKYDAFSKHPSKASKDWLPSRNFEQRSKRPRYSRKDALSVHRNILREDRVPLSTEIKRSPRVVKYVADDNGFALREDLVQPLQKTIRRSRKRPRILTAASSPLMAKVVSSAIRVSNNQPSSAEGKFVPQIIDLKVGK